MWEFEFARGEVARAPVTLVRRPFVVLEFPLVDELPWGGGDSASNGGDSEKSFHPDGWWKADNSKQVTLERRWMCRGPRTEATVGGDGRRPSEEGSIAVLFKSSLASRSISVEGDIGICVP